MVFFNKCDMKYTYEDIDKMDMDVLLITYESLLEGKYQEYLEYEKINKQMPK